MKDDIDYIVTLLKKKKRKAIIIAAVIIVAVSSIVIFSKGYTNAREKYETEIQELEAEIERLSDPTAIYEEASKEVDIHIINTEIQEIGELATVEYFYTDAGKFEDPAKLFGKDIPFSFTTKSFIAKWDGVIKAGVDISKVTAELRDSAQDSGDTSMPSDKNKEIIIHIPKAEILSHEIDDESIETLDEKDGLFNKIKVEDIREFDLINKEAMEQRAIENGILDKAFENAKEIIYRLIYTDAMKELEYTITFQEMEE